MFQYSHETISTDVQEIDNIIADINQDVLAYALDFEDGTVMYFENTNDAPLIFENYDINTTDVQAQNDDFETTVDDILDFTDHNPFGEVYNR